MKLSEKWNRIVSRFELLEHTLSLPETGADGTRYAAAMKEYSELLPIVEKIRAYSQQLQQMQDAETMMRCDSDPAVRALASEEYAFLREELAVREKEISRLLIPSDPNDDKNVVVEIRAGTGGEEAALFVGTLFRMYTMYAESHGFRCEIASVNETELGGYKEITFLVSGKSVYSKFKFESGVHRVQRVPETESSGRIHTSAATVAILPEAESVQVEILPGDLQIDTIKSSGAGGQHINKTESAIRLIHKPTGIVIECQDERSQLQNKEKAMRLLRTRLYERKCREQEEAIASERRSQVGSGDRSERIRTYNFPQGRVTDHRIGLTLYSLDTFVDGDMDTVIDALREADAAEKLKESDDES